MNKIYVGNLPYTTDERGLEDIFGVCGEIVDVVVIRDRETKRSKGFGFVDFQDASAADQALAMNGTEIQGRTLKVSLAKERQAGGGGRSGGAGRSGGGFRGGDRNGGGYHRGGDGYHGGGFNGNG